MEINYDGLFEWFRQVNVLVCGIIRTSGLTLISKEQIWFQGFYEKIRVRYSRIKV